MTKKNSPSKTGAWIQSMNNSNGSLWGHALTFNGSRAPAKGLIDIIENRIYYPTSFLEQGHKLRDVDIMRPNSAETHFYIPITTANIKEMLQFDDILTERARVFGKLWMERYYISRKYAQLLEQPVTKEEIDNWIPFKNMPAKIHQADGMARMVRAPYGILAPDPGLGKTYMVVRHFLHLLREVGSVKALIVSNLVSLDYVWVDHFTNMAPHLKVINLSKARKRKGFPKIDLSEFDVYIVNYDILSTMGEQLSELDYDVLYFDEATYVKSPDAARSKALFRLARKANRRWGLSGTPMPNGIFDIWHLFFILDEGLTLGTSFTHFKTKTSHIIKVGDEGSLSFYKPTKRGIALTMGAIKPFLLRYKAEDCIDIAPANRIVRRFDMTQVQRKFYDDLVEEYVATLPDGEEIQVRSVLAGFTKGRQATRNFVTITTYEENPDDPDAEAEEHKEIRVIDEHANPAINILDSLLHEIGPDRKVIIWAWFQEDVRNVVRLLEKRKEPYRAISGAFSGVNKEKALEEFDNDPTINRLVANQKTLAFAITFKNVQYAIYYSQPYDFDLRYQSERRNWGRIGLGGKVFFYDIVCHDSIDNEIMDKLRRMADLQSEHVDRAAKWTNKLKHETATKEQILKLLKGG